MLRIASGSAEALEASTPRDLFPRIRVSLLGALMGVLAVGAFAPAVRAEDDYNMKVSKDPPPESPDHWWTCEEAKAAQEVMVRVDGIKDDNGNLRIQLYDDKPDHFLAKGWKLYRRDVAIVGDSMEICVPVPKPGVYALVVIHDENKNGKFDVFSEGFGFSNNPKIRFSTPDLEDVAFKVDPGITTIDIDMKYIFGSRSKPTRRGGKF
jgi:uncharacterized protein (DUF2141 family)